MWCVCGIKEKQIKCSVAHLWAMEEQRRQLIKKKIQFSSNIKCWKYPHVVHKKIYIYRNARVRLYTQRFHTVEFAAFWFFHSFERLFVRRSPFTLSHATHFWMALVSAYFMFWGCVYCDLVNIKFIRISAKINGNHFLPLSFFSFVVKVFFRYTRFCIFLPHENQMLDLILHSTKDLCVSTKVFNAFYMWIDLSAARAQRWC